MKFDTPDCPECGHVAIGTLDDVPVVAAFEMDADGEFGYTGITDVEWDGQFTRLYSDGRATLVCEKGHEWGSFGSGYDGAPSKSTQRTYR